MGFWLLRSVTKSKKRAFLLLFPLLLLIYYVHHSRVRKLAIDAYVSEQNLRFKTRLAREKIATLRRASKTTNFVDDGLAEIERLLEGGGGGEDTEDNCGGATTAESAVCGEIYAGPYKGSSNEDSWVIDFDGCPENVRKKRLSDLVTIVTVFDGAGTTLRAFSEELTSHMGPKYSGIRVSVGTTTGAHEKSPSGHAAVVVDSFATGTTESQMWRSLIGKARTEFVLLARSVRTLYGRWMNVERSIRLLQSERTAAVGGATLNSTGHWRTSCQQADVRFYNLVLRDGYSKSSCSCMECHIVRGPFVARTRQLDDLKSDLHPDLMFNDWFMSLKDEHLVSLQCPDVLYVTSDSLDVGRGPSREDWKRWARLRGFQGVSFYRPPQQIHRFSCEEVDLECQPFASSDQHLLTPWCCAKAYLHMLEKFDGVVRKLGFSYEITTGSLLGAVKFNNFIPWDVDGDVQLPTEAMHLFQSGAAGNRLLSEAGIRVYDIKRDNYADEGAGYFKMWMSGMFVEVMGKRGNMSLSDEAYTKDVVPAVPTRIRVGESSWLATHSNPGTYLRGMYRSDFLQHAQSWRAIPTMDKFDDSYAENTKGGWPSCEAESHSCLSRYPTDGNVDWLPEILQL